MAETPAKRQKVGHGNQPSNNRSSFEDFAPDGDVVFILRGKTRVLVRSAVMKGASSVFSAMLGPNFKEGRALAEAGDAPIEMPLPEDNDLYFGWICRALHCQAHTRLWKPSIYQIIDAWSIVDKYDMKDSMQLSFSFWVSEQIKTVQHDQALWCLTVISLLSQDADSFAAATRKFILRTTVPVIKPLRRRSTALKALFLGVQSTSSQVHHYLVFPLSLQEIINHYSSSAGELQAARDCAMTRSTKLLYGDLPNTTGCSKTFWAYSNKLKGELHKCKPKSLTFMDTTAPLSCVRPVVSSINELTIKQDCTCCRCAAAMPNFAEQISKFLKIEVDGLCLDCFNKEPCLEHKSE